MAVVSSPFNKTVEGDKAYSYVWSVSELGLSVASEHSHVLDHGDPFGYLLIISQVLDRDKEHAEGQAKRELKKLI